ncbi:MAG: cytochrome-c peroxidase [Thermoguttaceae bacterium]
MKHLLFPLLFVVATPMFLLGQSPIPKGPHGAATESFQQKVLGVLQRETEERPEGVDPEYWSFLISEDNRPTEDRVALGKKLYFDPRLSKDGTVSCATCHDTTRGFTDQRATSEGIGAQIGKRNSPTTMNVAFLHTMFWDGRSPSIEHQAMQPIINPIEMGMPDEELAIIAGIKDDPEYVELFEKAYGNPVNYKDIGRAIATFERTLLFLDSPVRQFLNGDQNAISENAKKGWILFNTKGRCVTCHAISPSNPIGSDNKFHNIGISAQLQNFEELSHQALAALETDSSDSALDELALSSDAGELGRFLVTKNKSDIGAFRTPSLSNVGITAPYMHDGSLLTLWDVVDHYNKGGVRNEYLDGGVEPLNLSEQEVAQLVEFLFALTDSRFADQNHREQVRQLHVAQKRDQRAHRDMVLAKRQKLQFEPQTRTGTLPSPQPLFENENHAMIDFVYPQK